jgi:hypothetical protein
MSSLRQGVPPVGLGGDERWHLVERITASHPFQKSARLRELLLYITEQTLCGHAHQLNEHNIGLAVFGKRADYSPLEDSSVRVHARQLRLRLHEYFDSVGVGESLILEIPKGSYVPEFRPARLPAPAQDQTRALVAETQPGLRQLLSWGLCGALALVCVFLAWRLSGARKTVPATPAEEPPWPLSEVFNSQHRTTIVVADVNYGMLRIMAQKPGSLEEYLRPDFPAGFAPVSISGQAAPIMKYISDSVLTSYADAATATSLLKLARAHADQVSVRSARDLRVRDLDEGNFILLGSPGSNPWVELFRDRLNFEEHEGRVGEGPKFFFNRRPLPSEPKTYEGLRWTGTAGTDYADIALLPNSRPRGEVLILQGLQQEGTEAAGLFLSDPENRHKLREALGVSPDSRTKSGFEVLIRTQAVDGAPSSGVLVATRLIR